MTVPDRPYLTEVEIFAIKFDALKGISKKALPILLRDIHDAIRRSEKRAKLDLLAKVEPLIPEHLLGKSCETVGIERNCPRCKLEKLRAEVSSPESAKGGGG